MSSCWDCEEPCSAARAASALGLALWIKWERETRDMKECTGQRRMSEEQHFLLVSLLRPLSYHTALGTPADMYLFLCQQFLAYLLTSGPLAVIGLSNMGEPIADSLMLLRWTP